ncbi:MAG: hypothetical protein WD051_14045 [Steroidobacteraceae bacterium]
MDEPITVPMADGDTPVDAAVAAIEAYRSDMPARATGTRPVQGARFNTHTQAFTYASERDAEIAAQTVEPADTLDGHDLQAEMNQLGTEISAEIAKYQAYTFHQQTGAKIFNLPEGSEARRVQDAKIGQLVETLKYQKAVFERALEAREVRAAAAARELNDKQVEYAFHKGDPKLKAAWDSAKLRREADLAVDVAIRARLGVLGS